MLKKEGSAKSTQRSGRVVESRASADMDEARIPEKADTSELVEVSLIRFAGYFLRLGTFGFGGPIEEVSGKANQRNLHEF